MPTENIGCALRRRNRLCEDESSVRRSDRSRKCSKSLVLDRRVGKDLPASRERLQIRTGGAYTRIEHGVGRKVSHPRHELTERFSRHPARTDQRLARLSCEVVDRLVLVALFSGERNADQRNLPARGHTVCESFPVAVRG